MPSKQIKNLFKKIFMSELIIGFKKYLEDKNARLTIIVTLVVSLIIIIAPLFNNKTKQSNPVASENLNHGQNKEQSQEYLSGYIPEGYVLIPLEIENIDSISNLVERAARADLYSSSQTLNGKRQLALKNIKIIRNAPDLSYFSALIEEGQNKHIEMLSQPVFAVLKSKKVRLNKNQKKVFKLKSKIEKIQGSAL